MTQTRDGVWEAPDSGRRLAFRLWLPDRPKALIVLVHGIWEHVKRYDHFAKALNARGLAVAGQDLWGHGDSSGTPGDFDSIQPFVEDLRGITEAVFRPASGSQRLVLFGHSLGGLIAVHWLLQGAPIERAVIQSPAIGLGVDIPAWKDRAARALARWCPWVSLPTGMDPRWLSRDPKVVKEYCDDPKIRVRLNARTYVAMDLAMRQAREAAGNIKTPILVLLGGGDQVISLEAARDWYKRIPAEKQLKEFPGAYHELHNDSLMEELAEEIDAWIKL